MTEIEKIIQEEVHTLYWDYDINCARTTLLTLGKLFHKEIKEQTVNAAVGLHGGGGYRAQCGIVEGCLMFIALMSKEEYMKSDTETASFCFDFVEMFEKKFKSLRCYDLRPDGFREDDPPHLCEELTKKGIQCAYAYCMELFHRNEKIAGTSGTNY